MITPLIMLFLMTFPYLLGLAYAGYRRQEFDQRAYASIGLGILFLFTCFGHFVQTGPMVEMLPPWVPERVTLVYLSGLLEFVIAIGFFLPKLRFSTGVLASLVLVGFFPINIYAAMHHVQMGGHAWGVSYLLIRGPLQLAILFWIYRFVLKAPPLAAKKGDTAYGQLNRSVR